MTYTCPSRQHHIIFHSYARLLPSNFLKAKKVCATEVTHTEKCETSICYHTKSFVFHIRNAKTKVRTFTKIKMPILIMWKQIFDFVWYPYFTINIFISKVNFEKIYLNQYHIISNSTIYKNKNAAAHSLSHIFCFIINCSEVTWHRS